MTPEERNMIAALNHCTMQPGSYEKRFVRDMAAQPGDYELSHKQRLFLNKVHWRYRKQIINLIQQGYTYQQPIEPSPDEEKPEEPTESQLAAQGIMVRYAPGVRQRKAVEAAKAALEEWNRKAREG